MILQRLNELYDRLLNDGEDIAVKGWSSKAISFHVVIDRKGNLKSIQDAGVYDGKKRTMPKMITPGDVSLGSGILSEFLNGSAEYMLGFDPKGIGKRSKDLNDAFKALHFEVEKGVGSPDFSAVCRFLKAWTPDQLTDEQRTLLSEIGGRGVFYLTGEPEPVFDDPEFRAWYDGKQGVTEEKITVGQCLITGDVGPLARTHEPSIKGVAGSSMSGSKLGGSNCRNFDSYGHEGGFNSPVSINAAFRYSTALNYLLKTGGPQKVSLGETTYVFWTRERSDAETEAACVIKDARSEDEKTALKKLKDYLEQAKELRQGELPQDEHPFYLLGLHGARGRISIRIFLESSVGDVRKNLLRFFEDTAMEGLSYPLTLWRILILTVYDPEKIPKNLPAFLLEAILTGRDYPESVAQRVIQRWKQDHGKYAGHSDAARAAFLKAYLNRNHQCNMSNELDQTNQSTAYRLGRAFAALEKCQKDSNERQGTEAGIRHQFLSSAVTTPSRVFPLLLRRQALWSKNLIEGSQVFYSNLLTDILGEESMKSFPARFSLEDQGAFFCGYYHQNQQLYKPKAQLMPNMAWDEKTQQFYKWVP